MGQLRTKILIKVLMQITHSKFELLVAAGLGNSGKVKWLIGQTQSCHLHVTYFLMVFINLI